MLECVRWNCLSRIFSSVISLPVTNLHLFPSKVIVPLGQTHSLGKLEMNDIICVMGTLTYNYNEKSSQGEKETSMHPVQTHTYT